MEGSIATHVLYVPPFPIHVTAALAGNGPPPPPHPPPASAVADSTFGPTDNAVASGGNTASGVAFLVSRSFQLLPAFLPSLPPPPSPPPSFISSFFPPSSSSPPPPPPPPSSSIGRKRGSAIISYPSGLSVEFPLFYSHHPP